MFINNFCIYIVIYITTIYKINVAVCVSSEDSTNDPTEPIIIDHIEEYYDIRPHKLTFVYDDDYLRGDESISPQKDSMAEVNKYMMNYPKIEPSNTYYSFIRNYNVSKSCSLDDDELRNRRNIFRRWGSGRDYGTPDLKELIEMNKNSGGVLLVDFFATWCGPCSRMNQNLEVIKSHYKSNKLTIHTIDVDKDRKYVDEYGINSLPSLLLFVKGNLYKKIVGLVDVKSLMRDIDESLDSIS